MDIILYLIPHKILERSIAKMTVTVFRNITFAMTEYGLDSFIIALFVVGNEVHQLYKGDNAHGHYTIFIKLHQIPK